jgi:hypothetical protein
MGDEKAVGFGYVCREGNAGGVFGYISVIRVCLALAASTLMHPNGSQADQKQEKGNIRFG